MLLFASVSALKPEEMPEVRMDTEKQNAGYEVYHQKLVWIPWQVIPFFLEQQFSSAAIKSGRGLLVIYRSQACGTKEKHKIRDQDLEPLA